MLNRNDGYYLSYKLLQLIPVALLFVDVVLMAMATVVGAFFGWIMTPLGFPYVSITGVWYGIFVGQLRQNEAMPAFLGISLLLIPIRFLVFKRFMYEKSSGQRAIRVFIHYDTNDVFGIICTILTVLFAVLTAIGTYLQYILQG